MAGFAAHEVFGEEVLQRFTEEEILSVIEEHRGVFGIGCQGPDLFLYNVPMLISGNDKNLGSRMHTEGTGRFFAYLWQTVWDAKEPLKIEVGLSYLYGFLAHYTLDCLTHPYVYARIGYDPEAEYSRKATRGLHQQLEAAMDAKILSVKKYVLPSQYKPYEVMEVDGQEREFLADILAEAVGRTYKIRLKRENVFGSIRLMRVIACRFYGGSEKYRKKLERWEKKLSEYYLFSNLMVTDDYICKRKVMNWENMPWRNPWDDDRVSTDSVWDLYNRAVEQYDAYRKEFSRLGQWTLEHLNGADRKKGEIKGHASAIIETSEFDREQDEVSAEIRRAVKKLGNRSYYSGISV